MAHAAAPEPAALHVHLRPPAPADTPALLALAAATGLFGAGEVEALLGDTLAALHAGTLGPGHGCAVACGDGGAVLGWTYVAPESERVWELLWIGVAASARRTGVGAALLADAQARAAAAGAATLRVCTSAGAATAAARAFYERAGFALVRTEADGYGPGDDKLTYEMDIKR